MSLTLRAYWRTWPVVFSSSCFSFYLLMVYSRFFVVSERLTVFHVLAGMLSFLTQSAVGIAKFHNLYSEAM